MWYVQDEHTLGRHKWLILTRLVLSTKTTDIMKLTGWNTCQFGRLKNDIIFRQTIKTLMEAKAGNSLLSARTFTHPLPTLVGSTKYSYTR